MARKAVRHRKVGKRKPKVLSRKVRLQISRKIRFLMHERVRGRRRWTQKQAIAIAHRMAGVSRNS